MSNTPVQKFRNGYVTANVWENDGFYAATVQRSYKDSDEIKNGGNFNHADLWSLARVVARAEAWIAEQ